MDNGGEDEYEPETNWVASAIASIRNLSLLRFQGGRAMATMVELLFKPALRIRSVQWSGWTVGNTLLGSYAIKNLQLQLPSMVVPSAPNWPATLRTVLLFKILLLNPLSFPPPSRDVIPALYSKCSPYLFFLCLSFITVSQYNYYASNLNLVFASQSTQTNRDMFYILSQGFSGEMDPVVHSNYEHVLLTH